ncbi:UDP-glycosyltransferase 85A2 [Spatholobus suberectus]|nr:UDP-glycosyltransferase 85A2 [Spatholobus suberectus]
MFSAQDCVLSSAYIIAISVCFASTDYNADESYLTDGYLDTKVDWIPGMKNFGLKDMPGFVRTTDPNDFILKWQKKFTEPLLSFLILLMN